MSTKRSVLVAGATGQQGGAVARQLLSRGHKVRALTRKPQGEAAKALASSGAEVVPGDLDDVGSLQSELAALSVQAELLEARRQVDTMIATYSQWR